MKVSLLITNFF